MYCYNSGSLVVMSVWNTLSQCSVDGKNLVWAVPEANEGIMSKGRGHWDG